ncbi:MAG: glycoside hydrolase family 125 protein [Velocimicrobium sp.]
MKNNYICTGNEMISLPCIRQEDGSILDVTILHMGYKGLIDIRGTTKYPLLRPIVQVDGEEVCFDTIQWERENYWIPHFEASSKEIKVTGTVLAPINERGFAYPICVTNKGNISHKITLGFEGCWSSTYHSINEDKKIEAPVFVYESAWNQSLVFDLRIGVSVFAFAPMFGEEMKTQYHQTSEGIFFRFEKEYEIKPGKERVLDCFFGIGVEEVAATTAAKEMYRFGYEKERKRTKEWLEKRCLKLSDDSLQEIFHQNLFFNFFYASGRTIDTEELVLVTSRSPRYYVSAAYWDRDSLLWSFPSILLADPSYAREMLMYVFGRQRRNFGLHSRYIDGTLLEPGFELDELCAPVIALSNYISATGEKDILDKEEIKEGIALILRRLNENRHPDIALYQTFLQPTDDMHVYPYLTYDNVLVWYVYKCLADLHQGRWEAETIKALLDEADAVHQAVFANCIKEHQGKQIFAWSVDLEGSRDVYDEPPGSLQLMPFYGFLEAEDPIYKNTVEVIRSPQYPYSFYGSPIAEIGCPHAPHPWVLSIANSLLCGRLESSKNILLKLKMDNGVACESVDENTGESATGDAFATCAGFLAYAIYEAFHK